MTMRLVLPLAIALALTFAGSTAGAQTAAPAPTGPLANALGYFAGSWNCKGGLIKDAARPAIVAFDWELGNALMEQQVDVAAAGKLPAYRAANYSSYDAHKKRVVSAGVNMYGEWYVSWTAGWKGNKLTWADLANSDNKPGKDVITKVDASTFDDAGYDNKGKLEFRAHCIKAPGQAEK